MDSESKVEKPPQFMAAISLTCSARGGIAWNVQGELSREAMLVVPLILNWVKCEDEQDQKKTLKKAYVHKLTQREFPIPDFSLPPVRVCTS